MGYNPQKAKEGGLPADLIIEGEIIDLRDGVVSDFVNEEHLKKWKSPKQPAIEIDVAAKYNERVVGFRKIFPYTIEGEETVYGRTSDLGKYKKKYEKLPEKGDKIKVMTNTDGFLRLKLD